MELNSEYRATYFDDFIGEAAVSKGKATLFIRSWGWNNTTDVAAINASREFYKPLIPLDIWTAMDQSEFSFVECDNIEEISEWCEDTFPESQAGTTDQSKYIFYALYNALGQIIDSNE
jgi:hypothetical protein